MAINNDLAEIKTYSKEEFEFLQQLCSKSKIGLIPISNINVPERIFLFEQREELGTLMMVLKNKKTKHNSIANSIIENNKTKFPYFI
jgi:hypothetical protein